MGYQPCPGIHSPSFATEKPGRRGSQVKISVRAADHPGERVRNAESQGCAEWPISDNARLPGSVWELTRGGLRLASEGDAVYTAEAGGWIWVRAPET